VVPGTLGRPRGRLDERTSHSAQTTPLTACVPARWRCEQLPLIGRAAGSSRVAPGQGQHRGDDRTAVEPRASRWLRRPGRCSAAVGGPRPRQLGTGDAGAALASSAATSMRALRSLGPGPRDRGGSPGTPTVHGSTCAAPVGSPDPDPRGRSWRAPRLGGGTLTIRTAVRAGVDRDVGPRVPSGSATPLRPTVPPAATVRHRSTWNIAMWDEGCTPRRRPNWTHPPVARGQDARGSVHVDRRTGS
jgi:hypothetical protein